MLGGHLGNEANAMAPQFGSFDFSAFYRLLESQAKGAGPNHSGPNANPSLFRNALFVSYDGKQNVKHY